MKKTLVTALMICLSPAAFSAPSFLKCTLQSEAVDGGSVVVIQETIKDFSKMIYITTKSNAELKNLPVIVGVSKIAGAEKLDLTIVSKTSRTSVSTSGLGNVSLSLNESASGGDEVSVECVLVRALNR